jgi:N-acetylglucosamine kinase-like BadF-type ATPase
MSGEYVAGVDGGGTKTICSIIEISTQKEISTFTSGPCNKNSIGNEKAKKNIKESIEEAMKLQNIKESQISSVCLGLSGFGSEDDKNLAKEWTKELFPSGQNIVVHSDAFTNLSSGTLGELNGMIIIR